MLILYLKISRHISQIWCYQIYLVLPRSPQFPDAALAHKVVRYPVAGLCLNESLSADEIGWFHEQVERCLHTIFPSDPYSKLFLCPIAHFKMLTQFFDLLFISTPCLAM
jgi:hypothetical protein